MQYRRQEQPGCGGCLLVVLLIIFVTGGAPALINFMGALIFSGFAGILLLMAMFWGFSYWIQKRVATYEQSQSESHNRFVWLLVQILMHIARIDGEVTRDEVQTIQRFFQHNLRYSQTQMMWVKELIKEATNSTVTLESLLMEFKNTFAYEPRLILLELVYQVLYTKTTVPENELRIARNIASYLDITAYDQRTIEARYQYRNRQETARTVDRAAQYYAVLGLEPGANDEEIKKAYRKLSMQYHPDKVRHLGDEFRKVAEEKMKEINIAYDFFKKK
ncbi:DnaJ domain-containing protein [Desulfopila aestuarii]|uniref:DnaJ like chaperone protein n=1 Tax=Desulfopila aestuarii DSM 18488 TaxID=1121416 RepID=A0A1M7Y3W2_9BACT|nr:DnaJ domain-containing protein [Desulfopila aestuarii]SHO46868.1 DnaJ like chaperone protein [Desulfopila aestuarii DSM 18488]